MAFWKASGTGQSAKIESLAFNVVLRGSGTRKPLLNTPGPEAPTAMKSRGRERKSSRAPVIKPRSINGSKMEGSAHSKVRAPAAAETEQHSASRKEGSASSAVDEGILHLGRSGMAR